MKSLHHWRRSACIAILVLTTLIATAPSNSVRAVEVVLDGLGAGEAVELTELLDRWREVTENEPGRPTPFSQTGIEVLARELAAIYLLPPDGRNKALTALRKGSLIELLPVGELTKYCEETDRVASLVTTGSTDPLAVKLPAQVVHAAPVLAALQSVLPGLLQDLDGIATVDETTILARLRSVLESFVKLQHARAALELVVGRAEAPNASAGAKLLKSVLDKAGPVRELMYRLPAAMLPELKLCRAENEPWPPLPVLDPQTSALWHQVEIAFEEFSVATESRLQSIIDKATAEVAGFPPLKEYVEPALNFQRSIEQQAKWRVAFEYTASTGGESGQVDLVAVNDPLRLTIPLGITITRVSRTRSADGGVSLHFAPDAFLQTGSVDTTVLQSGLAAMGLPPWAHLTAVDLSVSSDLRMISLVSHISIEALGIELNQPLVLHDGTKLIDLEADLRELVGQLARESGKQLLANVPRFTTAWGEVNLSVETVTIKKLVTNNPWQLAIVGRIPSPFGVPDPIVVELALGESRQKPFRLLSATASSDLEEALLETVTKAFDRILDSAKLAPLEARPYLLSCLVLKGVTLHSGIETTLGISLAIDAGGTTHDFKISSGELWKFGDELLKAVTGDVAKCIGREQALYIARSALGLTPNQVQEYLTALQQAKLSMLGLEFVVSNIQAPAEKRGFIFDLVGTTAGEQVRFGQLELHVDLWQPKSPLVVTAVNFAAATIAPQDVRRLLLNATGLPANLLDSVDVELRGGVLIVAPKLTVEAFGDVIEVPSISLRPNMTRAEVRDIVLTAANKVIGDLLEARLGSLLPDIGPIDSVTLDGANSTFLPIDGQDAKLALKVVTKLEFFSVAWNVTLTIDGRGRSTIQVTSGSVEEQ